MSGVLNNQYAVIVKKKRDSGWLRDNLVEIVSSLWASFMSEQSVYTVKLSIVPNICYEKIFIQDNVCMNSFHQFLIEKFVTLKKKIYSIWHCVCVWTVVICLVVTYIHVCNRFWLGFPSNYIPLAVFLCVEFSPGGCRPPFWFVHSNVRCLLPLPHVSCFVVVKSCNLLVCTAGPIALKWNAWGCWE